MDIPGIFHDADSNLEDSKQTSGQADGSSAVISVDGLIGGSGDDSIMTAGGSSSPSDDAVVLDGGIIPNETVKTNDLSVVGEVKPFEEKLEPSLEPFIPEIDSPQIPAVEENASPEPSPAIVESDSPEKIDFIKTYTAEYDDTLNRATETIKKVLGSVDNSIHEKLPDISIPEEANEFLKKPPIDNKVEKFEEVREIVHAIMDRAVEAKQQSQAAATEAARIYDEVQAFKKETEQKITELVQS